MAKPIKHKQFLEMIAFDSGVSVKSVERVWKSLLKIIYDELMMQGQITMQNFCRIAVKEVEAMEWTDKHGVRHSIPKHCQLSYRTMPRLKNYINGKVTKYGKKKVLKHDPLDPDVKRLERQQAERTVEALLNYKQSSGDDISDIIKDKSDIITEKMVEIMDVDEDQYEEDGTIV